MMISIVATVIRGFWLITEWVHSLNHKAESFDRDKFSKIIWDIGTCIGIVGIIVGFTSTGRIETDNNFLALSGIIILLAGLAIGGRLFILWANISPAR